jgi:pimeloyl-ACP methyl ester carboxylesterase
VVVVPGILGSRLCKGTEVVWGERTSLSNFSRLDLGGPSPEPLSPCGLVDQISILGPFWKIDAYSSLIEKLKSLGYQNGQRLFVFDYDWRQTNEETADRLAKYVAKINAPEVDIIAHSMGGLVTTLMLQKGVERPRVRKVIFLGTPFLGSMNVFATLSEGWGGFQDLIAGGIDSIRRTMLSMPSIYELLPSYENCCRLGTAAQYDYVDPFVPENWRKYRWLPEEYDDGGRAAYFDSNLKRAGRLKEIFRSQLPGSVAVTRVVSDVFATGIYLIVSPSDPSWRKWSFEKARGDQTVPAWSAANNFKTLAGTSPSFSVHGTIFKDRTVESIVERELLDIPAPKEAPLRLLTTAGGLPKSFEYIDFDVTPNTVSSGGKASVNLSIDWGQPASRGDVAPRAFLEGPNGRVEVALTETTEDGSKTSKFVGAIDGPQETGNWPVILNFPPIDSELGAVLTTHR